MAKYPVGEGKPITPEQVAIQDPKEWAHESYVLSQTTVYPGVVEGQELSDEYIAKAKTVAERQVVLGGLRLAHTLKSFHLAEKMGSGHIEPYSKRRSLSYRLFAKFVQAMNYF